MKKIAIQSRAYSGMCSLPSGLNVTVAEAKAKGYHVAASAAHAHALASHLDMANLQNATYAEAVMALPEAADRPLAAAKVAAAYGPMAMPLSRASLFLAGLPIETADVPPPAPPTKADMAAELKLRRRVELEAGGARFQADRGAPGARKKANDLSYALSIVAGSTNVNIRTALSQAGCDASFLKETA